MCSSLIQTDSDDSSDLDDCDLSGIRPIDTSFRAGINNSPTKSPKSKKRRIDRKMFNSSIVHEELCNDSTHSNLKYVRATGTVSYNSQIPDKLNDERGCIMFLSYRERRDNQNDLQISLIIYKPNSKNVKSRRNLMLEFGESSSAATSEEQSETPIGKSTENLLTTPSKSTGKSDNFRSVSSRKRKLDTKVSLRF